MNEILKQLRQQKDVTQKEVARCLGISESAYSNYEQGIREPSIDILKRLCLYYEVPSDYLIGIVNDFGNVIPQQTFTESATDKSEEYILKTFRSLSGRDRELFLGFVSNFDRPVSEIKKARKNRA